MQGRGCVLRFHRGKVLPAQLSTNGGEPVACLRTSRRPPSGGCALASPTGRSPRKPASARVAYRGSEPLRPGQARRPKSWRSRTARDSRQTGEVLAPLGVRKPAWWSTCRESAMQPRCGKGVITAALRLLVGLARHTPYPPPFSCRKKGVLSPSWTGHRRF